MSENEEQYIEEDALEEEDLGDGGGDDRLEQTEPFDPKKVDVSISNPNLGALIERLRHKEIDLMPDFQRSGDLWSKQAQSRLIESILIRLPVPAFYFDAIDDEKWQIVDGLQRLSAIKNFIIDKKLALTNLEFLKEYEGAHYDDLPRALRRRIDEFQTSVYLIKPGTPFVMKYSLFNRINTGGLKLTPQEIRHAMSQSIRKGVASRFLTSITKEPAFQKVVGNKGKRMSYQELILRHMAFRLFDISNYKSSLPKFLDAAMNELGKVDDSVLQDLKKTFLLSVDTAYKVFGKDSFRRTLADPNRNKVVNKPLFESLSVNLALINDEVRNNIVNNSESFRKEFKELLQSERFSRSITRSTANTENVVTRFKEIRELIYRYE